MASSEEYLAALGFDTSDVDKSVQQTITILGHLANQFDEVAPSADKAARAMSKSTEASRSAAGAASAQSKAEQTRNRALETASKQTALYNQYLYDQDAGLKQNEGNLARLRYALYDVSNALFVGGAAAAAFVAGIVGTNVAFEREFADVRRTVGVTGDSADELYQKFIRLSTQIPVAFSSLTEIGTLAGQLGILEDRVASFTQTTAQFSATTDVSVEASATAFGRLDQLIEGVDGRYQNLASSILNVGINSVATESQIIGIASQIAATGNQAGLTADEVIGLAGSLASLGVAPEAARGTVLRVFSEINKAVATGGEALNNFANISGLSSEEFQRGWSTDFTSTFLAFLNGIDSNGQGAETAIRALGITAARDVNALLKLSQNTDAVARNLDLAADGFSNAGILAENFGIIAATNASRLQILVQTVQAFAATVGSATNGPLAGFLGYLQNLLNALLAFANTPIGQGLSFFATVLGAVLAVMLLAGAAALRTAGSFLALKTAISEAYLQTMLARGGMQGFAASLFGAAGGATALSAALKATGVGLLVTGGLALLGEVIGQVGKLMESGEQQAEAYFGTLDGLSAAIRADNPVAEQVERARRSMEDAESTGESWTSVLREAAAAQEELRSGTDDAGNAIDNQTLRIGENTQQWLRNQLASSEAFQEIFKNLAGLDALTGDDMFTDSNTGVTVQYEAFDLEQYIRLASTKGIDAATAFFDAWQAGLGQKFGEATDNVVLLENIIPPETYQKVEEAGVQIANAVQTGIADAASSDAQNALLDAILGPLDEGADATSAAFDTLMDDVFGVVNAEAELADATRRLGSEFATNGSAVASSGQAMQSVIAGIFSSSSGAPEAAARMQGLFDALVQGGYASASQLAGLAAIIASLSGGKAINSLPFQMDDFAAGLNSVEEAAGGGGGGGGAAAAIRTLVDYANDLQGVFSRSFDIRFGGAQAADDIASGWNAIRESIAKVNTEIQKYSAEMQELTADRAVREYWLSVAENYGDALRAGELRAELAKIDNDLADTSSDLAKAQDKGSKSLVGSSEAAIENREEILGLVQGYQDYITALAAAGVPQDQLQAIAAQLKQEFISQATQLGYNVNELGTYAAAFDDVSIAIQNVPRNITVTADANPAIQALNEFAAKAQAIVGGGVSIPIRTVADNSGVAAAIRGQILLHEGKRDAAYAEHLSAAANEQQQAINALYAKLSALGFKSGGWTGGGGVNDVAGFVHGQEFVLNQRGAQMFPRQMLDSANQGRNPFQNVRATPSVTKMPGVIEVRLSAEDKMLLADGKKVTVVVAADQVGRAAGTSFSDNDRRGG